MFEQSAVVAVEKRPWTFLVSAAGQTLAAALLMTLPLIHTERMAYAPPAPLAMPLLRPAEPPAAAEPRRTPRSPSRAPRPWFDWSVFRAPARIPDTIALIPYDAAPSLNNGAERSAFRAGSQDGVPSGLGGYAPPPPPPPTPKPAEAKTTPAEPVRVSGGVQEAKLIHKVVPLYPPIAKTARISGTVRLLATVGADGRIKRLEVQSGSPYLVAATLEAVMQWVYRPTLLNGQPVGVIAPIDVIFTLSP